MAWNKKKKDDDEEEVVIEEITGKDIEKLRTDLKKYASNYRFRDYLLDLNVISIKKGAWVVHDTAGYQRLSKINSKLNIRQYYEDQEHFAAFPEARVAQLERLVALRNKMKA